MVLMVSSVADKVSSALPGVVQKVDNKVQWVTPGGRHADFHSEASVLVTVWTRQNHQALPCEYNGMNPAAASRALRKQAYEFAFAEAFGPLNELSGHKYRATKIVRTEFNDGVILRLAVDGGRAASLEFKHTFTIAAQVRQLPGAFYFQEDLMDEIITDLWGDEEQMGDWFLEGMQTFLEDPDSLLTS